MTLTELEKQISQLPPAELAEFREWFRRFDSDRWDEQIKKDVNAGRLDSLASAALQEYREGKTDEV